MKKLLVVLVFILSTVWVFAQNTIHPAPLVFTYKSIFSGSDTTAPLSIKQFPQKDFIRGWQWSGRDRITDEMHSNMHHGGHLPATQAYTSGRKINIIPSMNNDVPFDLPIATLSYQFEPTLKIVNVGQLNYREHDKERSIFGSGNILGEAIITEQNTVNFVRFYDSNFI